MTDEQIELIARLRETFDPGGNLPEDCADWAREHDAAIDALEALLGRLPVPTKAEAKISA